MIRFLRAPVILFLFLTSCSSNDDAAPEVIKLDLEIVVVDHEQPVPNATITTQPETKTAITDAEGYAIIKNIAQGDYVVQVNVGDLEYDAEVRVSSKGENSYVIVLESIDPIGQAPVDYSELLNSIYVGLKSEALFDAQGYVSYWGDIGADVCYVNQNNFSYGQLDRYDLSPSDSFTATIWDEHYRYINLTNYGLDHLEETAAANPDLNETAVAGELRYLRALLYFNLVKIYGNPVLVTTAEIIWKIHRLLHRAVK